MPNEKQDFLGHPTPPLTRALAKQRSAHPNSTADTRGGAQGLETVWQKKSGQLEEAVGCSGPMGETSTVEINSHQQQKNDERGPSLENKGNQVTNLGAVPKRLGCQVGDFHKTPSAVASGNNIDLASLTSHIVNQTLLNAGYFRSNIHDQHISNADAYMNMAELHGTYSNFNSKDKGHDYNLLFVNDDVFRKLNETNTHVRDNKNTNVKDSGVNEMLGFIHDGNVGRFSTSFNQNHITYKDLQNFVNKFDNTEQGIHPVAFVRRLEELMVLNTIPFRYFTFICRNLFQGNAKSWADEFLDSFPDFQTFKLHFLEHFWGPTKQEKFKMALSKDKYRRKDGSYVDFFLNKLTKARYLNPPISENMLIPTITRLLPPSIYTSLIGVQSVKDVLDRLRQADYYYENEENDDFPTNQARARSRFVPQPAVGKNVSTLTVNCNDEDEVSGNEHLPTDRALR